MDKKIEFRTAKPSLIQYKKLREGVDWNLEEKGITDSRALDSLIKSPLCICAYEENGKDEKLIGMVRLSGDLSMYGYIQDTIVLPGYQGKGVGKGMMKKLFEELGEKPGYLLGVCPSKISVDFYESFGFKKRPENPNGFMSMEL